ncbi:RNA polymerase sigma factor [Streptomyces yaizuensis]|uniref:RNA polymerase sigma factor n=1 Tax=Streptomyces yaizuensis TaxID=2989713 RepID=A0ABQ5P584_9ACTN|nr:RNA polymerase sigma factor [Streptomyces sp. YSPA8]GLF97759.1 RNA polymerase sigma factor [Streptomyces sp. YSPA8]
MPKKTLGQPRATTRPAQRAPVRRPPSLSPRANGTTADGPARASTTDPAESALTDCLALSLDQGFTLLVQTHSAAVYGFLLRVTGSPAEAEDLGQETFLRAYTALRDYPPQRRRELKPRAWLMAIAANIWRNHVRTAVRRPVLTGTDETRELVLSRPDERPGPEERAALADDRARLTRALRNLPELYRVPVVLRHIIGLSYQEVAEVQGCPPGTVKAQVSRGVKALRAALEAAQDDRVVQEDAEEVAR